jgi:hypothetical protein
MAKTKRLRHSGWTAVSVAASALLAVAAPDRAVPAPAPAGAAATAAGSVARPAAGTLQPYKARYQVSYRGLSGGQIEATFRPGAASGQWLYETHAFPNLLGRIAVSPEAYQRSTMLVGSAGVKPVSFDFNDGSAEDEKDVRLRFDWTRNHVTGTADGKPIDLDVQPGTQDTASVQAAMIFERVSGRSPTSFRIITGRKVRDYRYWSEGLQQVNSPFGMVTAEVWASQREGSTRVQKVWHVPSLGYVPVQAIQYRKGSAEVQMKLLSLER